MEFLVIPDTYYENLRARLKGAPIQVKEDMNVVSWFYIKVILYIKVALVGLLTTCEVKMARY